MLSTQGPPSDQLNSSTGTGRAVAGAAVGSAGVGVGGGVSESVVTQSISRMLHQSDYREFTTDEFDAADYANKVIQGKNNTSGSSAYRGDIASALSKLSANIDHLNSQLHDQVATHYEDLLEQVSELGHLETVLVQIKDGLDHLNASFARVKSRVTTSHDQIQAHTEKLENVQRTGELLRRVKRFVNLIRRVAAEINSSDQQDENAGLGKAAINIHELDMLLKESNLKGIEVVDKCIPRFETFRNRVLTKSQALLDTGLSSQNQADIASALQVFYNMHSLSDKVRATLYALLDEIMSECQRAFSPESLTKEVKDIYSGNDKTRTANGPVNVTAPVYSLELWKRMEKLVDVMYDSAVKGYVLERVLSRKTDPLTQKTYLDEISKEMKGSIVSHFWKTLAASFDRELRIATKNSNYLNQIFQVGYPKLLRLFQDFFSRLTTSLPSTTSKISSASLSTLSLNDTKTQQPSTATPNITAEGSTALLKCLSSFEAAYLRESLSRILDPINLAFPEKPLLVGGLRPLPSRDDVEKVLRTVSRELEVAKFDKQLLKAVSKNVAKGLNMYAIRSESMVATDSSAYQVAGSGTASTSQILNVEIINCLWQLAEGIWNLQEEYVMDGDIVLANLKDSTENLHRLVAAVAEPLFSFFARDIESSILKIHKEDYVGDRKQNQANPRSPPRSGGQGNPSDGSISVYVVEVGQKLRWIQREVIARFSCGNDTKEWATTIGVRVMDYFVRQASLVRPLTSEAAKLRLTSDMTQLEFALNQWISGVGLKMDVALGDSYKSLRAFRQLLFLDLTQVTAAHHTAHLPPLVVIHHLIVRGHPYIPLPMAVFNWTEAQYSDWLDSHSERDAAALLSRCLDVYVEEVTRRGEREYRVEYPTVRSLLPQLLK